MPKKRQSGRSIPNVIRIYCEGSKTEPQYLRGHIDSLAAGGRRFVVEIEPTKKNTPVQLVDEAVDYRKSDRFVEGDILWVVYDREAPAKYTDELHSNAMHKATANGVKVALSNVCFEFWLLLHLKETSAPYSSYDDFRKQSDFRKIFRERFGTDYEKADAKVYDFLKPGVEDARIRAAKLNKRSLEEADHNRCKPFHLNPYTNVHELLDDIEALDEKVNVAAPVASD